MAVAPGVNPKLLEWFQERNVDPKRVAVTGYATERAPDGRVRVLWREVVVEHDGSIAAPPRFVDRHLVVDDAPPPLYDLP